MNIKKNSKQAKLIDKALKQYVNFLTLQTEERIKQFNYQNNFIEVENIANEHNEILVDIELLRKTLVDEPSKLELEKK